MELPSDLRFIALKYAGKCRSCRTALEVDQRAHWSPSLSSVWCADCAAGSSSDAGPERDAARVSPRRAATTASPRGSSSRMPGRDDRQAAWRQLCLYAQRCVEAESAKSLVLHAARHSRWFPHSGEEKLVVGLDDSVPATDGMTRELEAGSLSVIYGWPTVVLKDSVHRPKVSPLFVLQIEPDKGADGEWELHAAAEPEFNMAVTASGVFDPSIAAEVGELVGHGLPFGDIDALRNLAEEIARLLGLRTSQTLDTKVLDVDVGREPGIYNAAISVMAEASNYTDALRQELQQLQDRDDWSATAAAHLVPGGSPRRNAPQTPSGPLAAPLACNSSQQELLERLRTEPLTVIKGPPGTGKTQLVVNAVTNTWLDGGKVLVTSTNNRAVDVAVDRAMAEVRSGLLIRTGNRPARERVTDLIADACSQAEAENTNRASAQAWLRRAATGRSKLMSMLARLDELDQTLLGLLEARREVLEARSEAAQGLWAGPAAPPLHISSVVVQRHAERLLRTRLLPRLRARRLRRRLNCASAAPLELMVEWAMSDQRKAQLDAQIASGRGERDSLDSEIGDPSASLTEADQEWAAASLSAIHAETAARISSGASSLADFNRIAARTGRFGQAVRNSLEHLPGWACTTLATRASFVLKPAMFDLIIVDEASQCSLAAILPLAYRAKRLAVVGDPCQLTPIVPLNDRRLRDIAEQTGFKNDDLRERGIHHKDGSAYLAFEWATRPELPALLNEHYRCHPSIARWFNRTFYNDELTVLTGVSDAPPHDRPVGWHDVDGAARRPDGGSWQNVAEAEHTVMILRHMIEFGYRSVGVLTPFAAQARHIDHLASQALGRETLNEARFVSGTAHRLQGDERDAIIVSTVLAPGMSAGAVAWIEQERNLLNVAVSRARRALTVVGHPRIEELGSPTLASLRAYLREVAVHEVDPAQSARFRVDSTAERLLLEAMQLNDLEPYAKLTVQGYEMDFALLEGGIKLNIEVDGDQHLDDRGQQRRQDIIRDRLLGRIGWTVRRVPAWRCHTEVAAVVDGIKQTRDLLSSLN